MLDRRDLAVALEPSAPVRSADPRRRVLDAFMRTVALGGYDRTTIDRVLALAEVPAPVFYEHFEDKQDCLLAALDESIARIEAAISERVEDSASWPERVRVGLQTLLAALADDPAGARVAFVECLSAGEPAIARVRSAMASFVPTLEEGRSRNGGCCERSGSPDSDAETADVDTAHLPPQTSEALVGGIASILHRRVLEGHTAQLPTLLGDLLYFTLMPYLGHDRALAASESASAGA
ncbi:MAG TPA: TetR/AcrR family transcriptional regulator [Solirubrobacteraceae bacterium]|jgi:AcrR family transcriptional regulator|nr:TetR/AcrR family transcriptional regulator [Solirubrobacteraceae bacterium]